MDSPQGASGKGQEITSVSCILRSRRRCQRTMGGSSRDGYAGYTLWSLLLSGNPERQDAECLIAGAA